MTIYSFQAGLPLGSIRPGKYVRAEELRDLLFEWEKRLTNDGLTATMSDVTKEMNRERWSLHCEPKAPPEEWSYRGEKVKDMSRDRLVEVVDLLCDGARDRSAPLYGTSKE